ncbi:MAG: CAP domain-containing protein [Burkholderiaceae bacterium]
MSFAKNAAPSWRRFSHATLLLAAAAVWPAAVHGQSNGVPLPVNLAPATSLKSNPVDLTRSQAIARAGELINTIRQKLDACGDSGMMALSQEPAKQAPVAQIPSRPLLQWNTQLASAAEQHARAMVEQRFFDHVDPAGDTVGNRVSRAGYRWRQVGENLAAGHESIEEAVQGWLLSTGHCEVMIDETFTEFGLAQVRSADPLDSYGVYWALVVAKPRQ